MTTPETELERLKVENSWLRMQLAFSQKLVEGYAQLGSANALLRDAAMRLAGRE